MLKNPIILTETEVKPLPEAETDTRETGSSLMFSGFILVAGILVYFLIPEVHIWINKAVEVLASNDREDTEHWVSSFGWFGPVLLVCAMVAQMFLVVVPTTALLVVSILVYGPLWGSALGLVAIYVASSAGYLLGRGFGAVTVEKVLGSKARKKSSAFLEKYGFWAIFITRLNPFLSNDVVSIVSGMVKINYWKFSVASLTGITPLIMFIAVLGENTDNLLFILSICSLGMLVIFCGYILMRRKQVRVVKLFELRDSFKRRFS